MRRRFSEQLDKEFTDGWQLGYDHALETAFKHRALDLNYYQGFIRGQSVTRGFVRPGAAMALKERRT